MSDTVGVPARQIRFLIAEGILPAATKTGRGADAYGEEHLSRARRYLMLHRLGMKPSAVKVLMAFDEALPVFQANGVEVRIDPSVDPSALNVDEVLSQIACALRAFQSKE